MGESKSKLPDLKELATMSGKLFHDIKTSVTQIIADYKAAREDEPSETAQKPPVTPTEPPNKKP
ncbi:MAG: hypothetical protein J0I93_10965 [Legionella sp.]|nr:hypothetical protein [Legionella sp.]